MRRVFLLFFFLSAVWPAAATRVTYQTLSEMLRPEYQIIKARVDSSSVEIEPNLLRVVVQVSQIVPVRSTSIPPCRLEHEFSTLIEREGVRVSPLRTGSGIERNLDRGAFYFFILGADGRSLLRVEPESSEAALRDAIRAF